MRRDFCVPPAVSLKIPDSATGDYDRTNPADTFYYVCKRGGYSGYPYKDVKAKTE